MREPADEGGARPDDGPPQVEDEGSRSGLWQWLAIGVLLACWLAEATLCAGTGP